MFLGESRDRKISSWTNKKNLQELDLKPSEISCQISYLSSSFMVVASSNTSLQSLRKARNSLMSDWYSVLLLSKASSSSRSSRLICKRDVWNKNLKRPIIYVQITATMLSLKEYTLVQRWISGIIPLLFSLLVLH